MKNAPPVGIIAGKGEFYIMAKVGDKIKILYMDGEPDYIGREGVIERIDSIGQLHGTWGGCAVIPQTDSYKVIEGAE